MSSYCIIQINIISDIIIIPSFFIVFLIFVKLSKCVYYFKYKAYEAYRCSNRMKLLVVVGWGGMAKL